jgi:hypothetical protein
MAISAGVPNDHLYVEVKMKEKPSFKPCSGKAALESSLSKFIKILLEHENVILACKIEFQQNFGVNSIGPQN